MNENIKLFLEKLAKDPEATAKISAIRDPEEAYAFASSMQDGFTKEEFISAMEELKEASKDSGDLTDEDLSKVAGGNPSISNVAVTAALSIGIPAIAAAIAAI